MTASSKTWRRFRRSRLAVLGLVVVTAFIFIAALGPLITPLDAYDQALGDRLKAPGYSFDEARTALAGTDHMGRDVLSRIILGSRISILVGVTAVTGAALIGLAFGLVAGYRGGLLDTMIMRLVDLQLSFPLMLLALAIIGLLGPSLQNLIIVFIVTGWPIFARIVRGAALSLKEEEFVVAARAMGKSDAGIMFRHLLPNLINPLIVTASFELARVIILEASIGFLGLGVQPPTPTWGNMLADGRGYLRDAWWLATFPGLAIVMVVAAVNFLGDGLRDALDPKAGG
ncbi:MAG: ABC transporter permease [Thermaerobacterales bacterium]